MKDTTNIEVFFCDTYALIELIGGNPNYVPYLKKTLLISEYNLVELYYSLLRDYGEQEADKYFGAWAQFSIRIPHSTIKQAMKFRLDHKKEALNYVDCIGYMFALEHGIKFLTGDQRFSSKEGVKFVK